MDHENLPPNANLYFDFDMPEQLPPPVVEPTLYQMDWSANIVTPHAQSAQELATRLFAAAEEMQRMADSGIVLLGPAEVDRWPVGTNSSEVAKAFKINLNEMPSFFLH
jgi:hypothetical protein